MHLLTFLLKEQSREGSNIYLVPICTLLQNFPTLFLGLLPWLGGGGWVGGGGGAILGRHVDVINTYSGEVPYNMDWGARPAYLVPMGCKKPFWTLLE